MSETHASTEHHDESGLYEIRLKGHLDNRWANWFEGLTITLEENGDTLLIGWNSNHHHAKIGCWKGAKNT
jgi:hypothetical protein